MEFLLFNEVLKNLIFFQLPITKVDFIMLIVVEIQPNFAGLSLKRGNEYCKIIKFRIEIIVIKRDLYDPLLLLVYK